MVYLNRERCVCSTAWFEGRHAELSKTLWPLLVQGVNDSHVGPRRTATKLTLINGTYHVVGCSSPEYNCYPPFESRACSTKVDCNYEIAQLRCGPWQPWPLPV